MTEMDKICLTSLFLGLLVVLTALLAFSLCKDRKSRPAMFHGVMFLFGFMLMAWPALYWLGRYVIVAAILAIWR